jgi:dCMP deaminase
MILGLTGQNAAGKGEVAEFLKKCGYTYFSLSDAIRDEIRGKGLDITRDRLIETGTYLRATFGASILGDRIRQKITPDMNAVVDSIRNPSEVEALKQLPDFFLLNIVAPAEQRFERIKTRARENDPNTLADFKRVEAAEEVSVDPNNQQLKATRALSDISIENTGTLDELYHKIRDLLRHLGRTVPRPTWDHYFMNIARQAALRSNCIKRKVAAVIVRDQRIISTGYNGTPRGTTNCNEGGCPRCNSFGESGKNLEDCLCSHAEENSITQAAYHGVSIKGSTIYTTFSPCLLCTKLIINSGIAEVVYAQRYAIDQVSTSLLKEAGVVIRQM